MSMFDLWVLFVLIPGLSATAGVVAVLLFVSGAALLVVGAVRDDYEDAVSPANKETKLVDKMFRGASMCFLAFALFFLIHSIIPGERHMYLLVGGYAATNIDGIDRLPKNIVNAANAYLEKATAGAQSEVEK